MLMWKVWTLSHMQMGSIRGFRVRLYYYKSRILEGKFNCIQDKLKIQEVTRGSGLVVEESKWASWEWDIFWAIEHTEN